MSDALTNNPITIGLLLGVCHDCLVGDHWECDDREGEAVANGEESDCPCFNANHGKQRADRGTTETGDA